MSDQRYVDSMSVQAPDLRLLVKRILVQQRATVATAATQALDILGSPPAGSPASRDQEWARQHEHPDTVVAAFAESVATVASLVKGQYFLPTGGQVKCPPVAS